jgi:hypothetical protein
MPPDLGPHFLFDESPDHLHNQTICEDLYSLLFSQVDLNPNAVKLTPKHTLIIKDINGIVLPNLTIGQVLDIMESNCQDNITINHHQITTEVILHRKL